MWTVAEISLKIVDYYLSDSKLLRKLISTLTGFTEWISLIINNNIIITLLMVIWGNVFQLCVSNWEPFVLINRYASISRFQKE